MNHKLKNKNLSNSYYLVIYMLITSTHQVHQINVDKQYVAEQIADLQMMKIKKPVHFILRCSLIT